MNYADLRFQLGSASAFGAREYLSSNRPWVIATAVLPRSVLQATFYVLVGRLVIGPQGLNDAFIGVVGYALVTATVVRIPDVLAADKREGTVYRVRTGVLPRFVVVLCRSWPYAVEGLGSALAVLTVTSLLVGEGHTALQLLRWLPYLPVLLLATLSLTGFGLVGAVASVGRRTDGLLGNLLSAIVLVSCQIVAPVSISWVSAVGQVLPLRHALAAIRTGIAGGDPLPQIGWEALVGLCWYAGAAGILRVQSYRAAREGIDDHE